MTRRSKRSLERAVDDLDAGGYNRPTGGDIPKSHAEAVVAALAYRYDNYGTLDGDPDGHPEERRAFFLDAANHIEEPHASVLREWFSGGDAEA